MGLESQCDKPQSWPLNDHQPCSAGLMVLAEPEPWPAVTGGAGVTDSEDRRRLSILRRSSLKTSLGQTRGEEKA